MRTTFSLNFIGPNCCLCSLFHLLIHVFSSFFANEMLLLVKVLKYVRTELSLTHVSHSLRYFCAIVLSTLYMYVVCICLRYPSSFVCAMTAEMALLFFRCYTLSIHFPDVLHRYVSVHFHKTIHNFVVKKAISRL